MELIFLEFPPLSSAKSIRLVLKRSIVVGSGNSLPSVSEPDFSTKLSLLTDKGKLLYAGVKVIDRTTSPHFMLSEAKKNILRLINDFKPQILVYEQGFFKNNKTAALLNVLINEIKAIGKRKRLVVMTGASNALIAMIKCNEYYCTTHCLIFFQLTKEKSTRQLTISKSTCNKSSL